MGLEFAADFHVVLVQETLFADSREADEKVGFKMDYGDAGKS
jgi:hypothetical protein